MRFLLACMSALAVAACGDPQSAPAAPATSAAPEAAVPADANGQTIEQISALLVGGFSSADDEKATISVTSDGKWTEAYEGAEPLTYSWRVFPGDAPPPGEPQTFTPASRYLELKRDGEVFYYELGVVAEDSFDMFYTARGNRLAYMRIKAPA